MPENTEVWLEIKKFHTITNNNESTFLTWTSPRRGRQNQKGKELKVKNE